MKIKFILSVASLSIIFLSGCTPVNTYSPFDNSNQVQNSPVTPAQAKIDAKILGTLVVLNQNELALATIAQQKASNPAVRNYAAWLYKAHSQNLQETQNVSQRIGLQPENGHTALMLQRQGRHEMAILNRLNNQAFDRAYISAMIKGHTGALHLINHKLLIEVTNPLLRRQLENTRAHVAEHLQQAKVVQREITHS